jgi:uncharacterized protein (TIGR03435 family)
MRHLSSKVVLVVAAIAIAAIFAAAQAPVQKPSFPVASIKPGLAGDNRSRGVGVEPSGRFTATNATLKQVMRNAYLVHDYQILGGPSWIATDRWNIEAKAEPDSIFSATDVTGVDQLALMLQSLLEDRFHLKVHRETGFFPIYELVVGKGGLRMPLAEDQTPRGSGRASATPPPRLPNGLPALTNFTSRWVFTPSGMNFEGKAIPLGRLVNLLVNVTNRKVIDKTGLTGLYDIKLEWTPDNLEAPFSPSVDRMQVSGSLTGPSLMTAIEEQLGLRLVSTPGGPVDVIVIDSVQKPSEN